MAMTRISDLIGYRGTIPANAEIGDVLTDPAPVAPPTIDEPGTPRQPSQNDLLRNALAIDRHLAESRRT